MTMNHLLDLVGDRVEHRIEPGAVCLGEGMQHIAVDQLLMAGMANADAHAPEIGTDGGVDGTDAVMTGSPATALGLNLAGGEVELVIEHDHPLRRQLIELHRFGHGVARPVHEGGRLQRQHLGQTDAAFRRHPLEPALGRAETVARRYALQCHEADIMPVQGKFGPGVTEPDQ